MEACNPPFKKNVKEMTCEDCRTNMNDVRRHITGEQQVTEMEHYLERHFCTAEIPHCPGFLRRHFPRVHRMVMDEYMHSDLICGAWGYC